VHKGVVARAGGLAGAAGIGIALASSALPGASGCYTHQCDAVSIPMTIGEWESTGSYVYETSPLQAPAGGETWIPFQHNVTLDITFPPNVAQDVNRLRLVPNGEAFAWISTSSQPNVDNAGFTPGPGSLALFTNITPTGFSVTNLTCASYYARFTVSFNMPASDASTEASVEASTDASADH